MTPVALVPNVSISASAVWLTLPCSFSAMTSSVSASATRDRGDQERGKGGQGTLHITRLQDGDQLTACRRKHVALNILGHLREGLTGPCEERCGGVLGYGRVSGIVSGRARVCIHGAVALLVSRGRWRIPRRYGAVRLACGARLGSSVGHVDDNGGESEVLVMYPRKQVSRWSDV
ncbi:hypothetical protein B0T19DRAFT_111040 [Cercophora scortea]|uniref:Uncharacterized protein n=1 Tax=Cercophora scortea TaxID=314031 RepID=A0AAE0IWX2_9PEZI|nr:hypothetical protein B0T19DRAFT_111040 [Cercophora scortea]